MADLKVFTKSIEPEALAQVELLLAQPAFRACKVRIMPDVHAGKGCVIGFTADLGDKVIPNIVGVDIGCGMLVTKLGERPLDLRRIDRIIRQEIPFGRNVHERADAYTALNDLACRHTLKDMDRLSCSIGTLGGGNHFIEIDADETGMQYLVIHTGSRSLGKQVADYYQDMAIDLQLGKRKLLADQAALIAEYTAAGRNAELQEAIRQLRIENQSIKDSAVKGLCYLEGEWREAYLHDMRICQAFAVANRARIRDILCSGIAVDLERAREDSFESIHNYIDLDSGIVRKGAIDASAGKRLLIPLNMRDGCIIGVGKGNEDWNCSAPHGAGRRLSRSQAKAKLSMEDYRREMSGIFTTSVSEETLDEAPDAYKPADEILSLLSETVTVERIIKPVYNFKASE
ncbi:MAG TPA: RtcB family protein [Candidatus Cryosericum sp.]|nr:RtcB family protein [Candidatus Cryosericum sp.]